MATEERVRTFGTKDIQDQLDSLLLEDFQQEFELAYCDESYSFCNRSPLQPARRVSVASTGRIDGAG